MTRDQQQSPDTCHIRADGTHVVYLAESITEAVADPNSATHHLALAVLAACEEAKRARPIRGNPIIA